MKRIVSLLVVAGFLLSATAGTQTKKEDIKKMIGTWDLVEGETSGGKFPAEIIKITKLTLTEDGYQVKIGEKSDKGTYQIDPAKTPKTIDITGTEGPNKGKIILAIYEFTGEKLRVCYDLGGKTRPTEFKPAAGANQVLFTYMRSKP